MRSGSPLLSGLTGSRRAPPNFPFIIGVAGGSSSGKSSVCEKIVEALGQNHKSAKERQVYIINQDSFYCALAEDEMKLAREFKFNFDHPRAVDVEQIKQTLKDIKADKPVTIPQYDYSTHSMDPEHTVTIAHADVIIVEGILVFYDQELRDMFDIKLFVDTDSDTRLARRVIRDTEERQRDLESVLQQYTRYVKPAFEEFCLPTKKHADVIVPRGSENTVAVSLIVQHIQDLLQCNNSRRSSLKGRDSSNSLNSNSSGSGSDLNGNIGGGLSLPEPEHPNQPSDPDLNQGHSKDGQGPSYTNTTPRPLPPTLCNGVGGSSRLYPISSTGPRGPGGGGVGEKPVLNGSVH